MVSCSILPESRRDVVVNYCLPTETLRSTRAHYCTVTGLAPCCERALRGDRSINTIAFLAFFFHNILNIRPSYYCINSNIVLLEAIPGGSLSIELQFQSCNHRERGGGLLPHYPRIISEGTVQIRPRAGVQMIPSPPHTVRYGVRISYWTPFQQGACLSDPR